MRSGGSSLSPDGSESPFAAVGYGWTLVYDRQLDKVFTVPPDDYLLAV